MEWTPRIEMSHTDLRDLPLDADLLLDIQRDLEASSKDFAPAWGWLDPLGDLGHPGTPEPLQTQHMLDCWSGFGKNQIDEASLFWWIDALSEIDVLGLVDAYFYLKDGWHCRTQDLTIADLGVMWDVNLMASYLKSFGVASPRIVEVGGGYGRLAEAFFSAYKTPAQYVLIDASPVSLMYAYVYLKKALVDRTVGIYYRDTKSLRDYDCYIVPVWRLDELDCSDLDLAINIQSMQEMDQHHVDYYFSLLNRITRPGGLIYLCNRRDHYFRGRWSIPDNWQCLLKCMCPRSWTREFPCEVFVNGTGDFSAANRIVDLQYQRAWTGVVGKRIHAATNLGYQPY